MIEELCLFCAGQESIVSPCLSAIAPSVPPIFPVTLVLSLACLLHASSLHIATNIMETSDHQQCHLNFPFHVFYSVIEIPNQWACT